MWNFIRKRKALRSKIQQNADMIELMVENVDTDEGTNVTTLTLTDKLIQAVTNQFIVKGADGTSTIISGGVLSTDALKSNNYEESLEEDPDAPKFSEAGTFVDLAEGSIYTPSLYFDGTTNEAYFRGTVYATNGTFNGTITSNDAVLGPWHLTSTSLYKGSRNFA